MATYKDDAIQPEILPETNKWTIRHKKVSIRLLEIDQRLADINTKKKVATELSIR